MASQWLCLGFLLHFLKQPGFIAEKFLHCCQFVMLYSKRSTAPNGVQWPPSVCDGLLGCVTAFFAFLCSNWIHAEKFLAHLYCCVTSEVQLQMKSNGHPTFQRIIDYQGTHSDKVVPGMAPFFLVMQQQHMDSVVVITLQKSKQTRRSKIRNFRDQRTKKQGNKGIAKKL